MERSRHPRHQRRWRVWPQTTKMTCSKQIARASLVDETVAITSQVNCWLRLFCYPFLHRFQRWKGKAIYVWIIESIKQWKMSMSVLFKGRWMHENHGLVWLLLILRSWPSSHLALSPLLGSFRQCTHLTGSAPFHLSVLRFIEVAFCLALLLSNKNSWQRVVAIVPDRAILSRQRCSMSVTTELHTLLWKHEHNLANGTGDSRWSFFLFFYEIRRQRNKRLQKEINTYLREARSASCANAPKSQQVTPCFAFTILCCEASSGSDWFLVPSGCPSVLVSGFC